MNHNIKDTDAKENSEIMGIVTGDKVIVRTKDFYPFLCSEREFSVIDVSTYNTLMSFKRITEEETDTEEAESEVVTDDNDTDPDDIDEDLEEDDEDVPVEIYEELLKYKELEHSKYARGNRYLAERAFAFWRQNNDLRLFCFAFHPNTLNRPPDSQGAALEVNILPSQTADLTYAQPHRNSKRNAESGCIDVAFQVFLQLFLLLFRQQTSCGLCTFGHDDIVKGIENVVLLLRVLENSVQQHQNVGNVPRRKPLIELCLYEPTDCF